MAPFSRSNMKTNDALQTNGHMMAAMAMLRVVLPFDLEMFSVVSFTSLMLGNVEKWTIIPKLSICVI